MNVSLLFASAVSAVTSMKLGLVFHDAPHDAPPTP
jgi:hypothetical protein